MSQDCSDNEIVAAWAQVLKTFITRNRAHVSIFMLLNKDFQRLYQQFQGLQTRPYEHSQLFFMSYKYFEPKVKSHHSTFTQNSPPKPICQARCATIKTYSIVVVTSMANLGIRHVDESTQVSGARDSRSMMRCLKLCVGRAGLGYMKPRGRSEKGLYVRCFVAFRWMSSDH